MDSYPHNSHLNNFEHIPVYSTVQVIIKSVNEIHEQAKLFKNQLECCTPLYQVELQEGTSQIGGKTMPDVELPTMVATVSQSKFITNELIVNLRKMKQAIITRVKDDKVLVDFRTISADEMNNLVKGFISVQ